MKTWFTVLAVALSIMMLQPSEAYSQQWEWAKEVADYSSGADIEGWSVATDGYGNIFATGAFYGDTITIAGSTYVSTGGGMFVIKYDSAGTVLWARVEGGSGVSVPRGITTDVSGNLIIATTFSGDSAVFGGSVLYNNGSPNQDICVVKYDPNGNILWAISTGTGSDEWLEGASTDQQGNIFITGSYDGTTITLGTTILTNTASGTEDIYIAKLDPNGLFLWAKSAGGTDYEWPTSISADAFGNAVISGVYFSGSVFFDVTNSLVSPYGTNHDQLFVCKYDSAGNVGWARQVLLTEQGYDSYFYDVATDVFGNVFAIGSCKSDTIFVDTLQLISSPASVRDMLLVKYSPGGLLQWARRETGTGDVYGFDLAVNTAGEAYATGYFNCDSIVFGNDTTLIIDQWFWSDMFLVKYKQSGTVDWAVNVGGTYMPGSWGYRQFGVACDQQERVSVIGTFINDSVAFGNNYVMLNNSWPNTYVAMLDDADVCAAAFTMVADTALLHHYWILNQATGTAPLSYVWDWGDGTQDTAAYPSHIYPTAAFYTICLTITDATGCTDTHCATNYLERPDENAAIVEVNVVATIPTGLDESEASELILYPNPALDHLILSNCLGANRIEISDICGKLNSISLVNSSANNHQIDVSGLRSGIYFLKVYFAEEFTIKKFIVMKN